MAKEPRLGIVQLHGDISIVRNKQCEEEINGNYNVYARRQMVNLKNWV